MSTRTAINRFMSSSSRTFAGLYQQLAASALSLHEFGSSLLRYAEQARCFRRTEQVKELGLMLANLPLQEFRMAGHYYVGWAMYRNGLREQSEVLLNQVAESAPATYRARALLTLGTLESASNDFASEARYYTEAFKVSDNLSTKVEAARGIAVIKAKEGYHKSSVTDFEKFLPLAIKSDAITYNFYISSLAVELGEVGRIHEARNINRAVLASPIAFAYPELQQTAEELRGASRSFVAIPSSNLPLNVLQLPPVERDNVELPAGIGKPAPVLSYQGWKNKMSSGKKINDSKSIDRMSEKEMVMEIVHILTSENVTYEQRRKVYEHVMKVLSNADRPQKADTPDGDKSGL